MERCPYCFKPLPDGGECGCHYEDSPNARIEEALRPGSIVGACYQIGAVLGQGGFGITYRGYDLDMQKVVAIKEFYPQGMVVRYGNITGEPVSGGRSNYVRSMNTEGKNVFRKSLDLFYREAVALGRLDKQPNVVHAHRIFRENGTAYIVMEFVEGQPLKEMIRERGRIPEEELLPLLEPVLTALDKVHQEGILHRDIAPDNIMIENGEPVLLDFGASRVEEGHHSSLVIGKRGYSSYEQMAGGDQDRRSDIYAMGATYYTALSGIVPQDAAMRGLNDKVIPLKELNLGISARTSNAVAKAMAIRPDDRWDTAAEFRDAMQENLDTDGIEHTYETALQLMEAGTAEGYHGAEILFKQMHGFKDSDRLAGECTRKAAELRSQSRPEEKRPQKTKESVSPDTGTSSKKNKKLPVFLAAAAGLALALFFILRPGTDPGKSGAGIPSGPSEQEMTLTALAAYKETSTAAAIQTKTQQIIDAELTAIAADRVKNTAIAHETETKQAEPTATPIPPTDTPAPASTNTPEPTAAKTPEPAAADLNELAQKGEDAYWNYDYAKALEYLIPAADAGNPYAKFRLGFMYMNGEGVQQSYETAAKYYQISADQDDAYNQYNIGSVYYYGKGILQSYETAAQYYQAAADQGHVYAQYKLGDMYQYGKGVQQSYETAVKYYQLAADQDYARAQYNLGVMYEYGYGVEQSYKTAMNYYQLAAKQGNEIAAEKVTELSETLADFDLYILAQKGEDTYWNGDYAEALEYLIPAADAGNPAAQFRLGYMYDYGQGVRQSYETAVKYYQLAADQGDASAQNNLGVMYKKGQGVRQSYETAVKYYQLAADQGDAVAQNNLGYMYKNGQGVKQSYETAVKYYQLAADQGYAQAQCNLGSMYYYGQGVRQSYETAVKYYQLAADQGYAQAQNNLGYMYENGQGVRQSYETAVKYYQLAADQGDTDAVEKVKELTEILGKTAKP